MLSMGIASFATVGPDFTATDCNGNSHNLYSELAAGKVIVLNWVMPCGACISASVSAYNVVQGQTSSNVLYYLIDDAGNTSCASLDTWANNSFIGSNRTTFSSSAIVENNYGGIGMPHVAVVGPNGNLYFNGLNSAANNPTAISNAINQALIATGIHEMNNNVFQLTATPDFLSHAVKASYSLIESGNVKLDIINILGQSVISKSIGKQSVGNYSTELDMNGIKNGVYFLRLNTEGRVETIKFIFAQ